MYLARFEVNDQDWIQAAARITPAPHQPPELDSWSLIAQQLSSAARIPDGTVVHRITVAPPRRVHHTIALTAPVQHEHRVREVVARLTRVERALGGSLLLPHAREQRDGWLEELAPLRLLSSAEAFSVGGLPLACDFRIADALDELLLDAVAGGHQLIYQVHIRYADPSPNDVRSARKNVLSLRQIPGIGAALVDWQDRLARALGHASAFCEEYLSVGTSTAADFACALLAERFRDRYGPLGFPVPAFRFENDAYQEPMVLGVHSHDLEPLPPVPLSGISTSGTERDRLLSWAPSSRLRDLLDHPFEDRATNGNELPPPVTGDIPEPYSGTGPFAFASYKRNDLPRVAPILKLVQQSGVPVWYDRGIPGGAEWDEVIEDRLSRARFVLMFASQAALDSKYVRREVKFADALDRPVLPIVLEDAQLLRGMRMLLTQYQMIDARAVDFVAQLRAAVDNLR